MPVPQVSGRASFFFPTRPVGVTHTQCPLPLLPSLPSLKEKRGKAQKPGQGRGVKCEVSSLLTWPIPSEVMLSK